jgi:hypothetical protein
LKSMVDLRFVLLGAYIQLAIMVAGDLQPCRITGR